MPWSALRMLEDPGIGVPHQPKIAKLIYNSDGPQNQPKNVIEVS